MRCARECSLALSLAALSLALARARLQERSDRELALQRGVQEGLLVEMQLVLGGGLVGRGGVGGERVRPQVGRGSGAVEKGGVQRF